MAAPIQTQPLWMPQPTDFVDMAPGLGYLGYIDQLLVKQKVEVGELMLNVETANKYTVYNNMGQQVYYAREGGDCCTRQLCGERRPFKLHIEDNMKQEVIRMVRPMRCHCFGQCCSISSCCQDEIRVEAPVENVIGYVKQTWECCRIRYNICDAAGRTVLKIHGPHYLQCYCPGDDIPFDLMNADGSARIGRIAKQWGNLATEIFTDADNFGIQFPLDLDIKIKAVVMGAVFLIDFMFFEDKGGKAGGKNTA